MIPPRYNRFQCAAALLQQWIVIIVAALALVTFPKAEAQTTTNSNVVISWDISQNGSPGYTGTVTNTNGVLTNSTGFANANQITYSNTTTTTALGVSDTAMTIYGFGSKATTSSKGFITYQNTLTLPTSTTTNAIPAAPTTTNLIQAVDQNSIITFSITPSIGYSLVLTNATGFVDIGGSLNAVTNWGLVWSTNADLTTLTTASTTNIIGIASVANGATTAMAPIFGSKLTTNPLTLNGGTTYYFGIAYWGGLSSGTANTIQSSASTNDFALLGYQLALASPLLKWAGNSGNWNSGNWLDTNGNPTTWSGSANDSALFTNASTNGNVYAISLLGGVTANSVTVSNTTGTITMGSGSLNALAFTMTGSGTLQLLQDTMFTNAMFLNVNGGTLDIQSNSQVSGALSLGGGTITGSGTLTPTSLTMSSGQILAPLAGSYAPTQSGAGTTELDGNNTFIGNVSIGYGVLKIGSAYALGSAVSYTHLTLPTTERV